tara:strand:+ start:535 stop:1974 length:1440 start_codon:yes stop_codon:yes gene_type:complete
MDKEKLFSDKWEMVIGLEVHVQLNSKTKMFTPTNWSYGESPNTQICPITLGYPGTLPMINSEAVRKGILIGLSLNCDINTITKFSRKHYFYPDLPKGYQITQFDKPLCEDGFVDIENKKIRILRAHLEEDAGKSIHTLEGDALIDYNRCGAPLLEIVSEPDMSSADEAMDYLKSLKEIISSIGASDCNMEKGNLRVDLNISVMPIGSKTFGTRREVKNVNSFRNVEKAIHYEYNYQCSRIESGEEIDQETLLWDDNNEMTKSIRTKEDAHDYRYFPEPDLPPLKVSNELIEEIKNTMPELPNQIRSDLSEKYKLNKDQIDYLLGNRKLLNYYRQLCGESFENSIKYYNWLSIQVVKYLKDKNLSITEFPIPINDLRQLIDLEINNKIDHSMAKKIFFKLVSSNQKFSEIITDVNTENNSSDDLKDCINSILKQNQEEHDRLINGEIKLVNFFIGLVMKATKGKYSPADISKYLNEKFNV